MNDSPVNGELVELRRTESALVRADLEHPSVVPAGDVRKLRYLLGFARLSAFQPGAAGGGRVAGRPDVSVGDEVAELRSRVVEQLTGPLRQEKNPPERLRRSRAALERLSEPLAQARRRLIKRHAGDSAPWRPRPRSPRPRRSPAP